MKPRNLIIATAVLAVLAGVIYWAQKHPNSGSSDTTPAASPKVADIAPTQVQSVQIAKRDGTTISIAKQNGKWAITGPQPYAADQDAVSSMLSSLSPLNADSVIEDKASDLSKYGLDQPAVAVAIGETNGRTAKLDLGNDVPTTSFVYATYGGSPKVYAITSSVKSSFDKAVNDLRDKRLLTVDSGKWNSLTLNGPKGSMEFSKNAQGDWTFVKPQPYRTDNFSVSELVRKLADARMDLSASADDRAKAKFGFAAGQLIARVTVGSDSAPQTLDVRKNKDDYYVSSSAVSGIFKSNSDLGQSLDKGPDDFRNKKLFEFGFNDPDKIQLDSKAYVRSGTDWKSSGQMMDPGTVQTLIDQVRELSATKFVTSGFTQPVATITVQWNSYKNTDQIEFAKAADGYIARRSGDSTLYQLEAKAVDDMLNAGKAIKPATKK